MRGFYLDTKFIQNSHRIFNFFEYHVFMAKYGKKAGEKVHKAVHEFKKGKLKSGSGHKVKSRKQAIAIGLSEAREEGAKVPEKKN